MLTDSFGRTHTYLRLAVTDRCNLRCRYCMPAEGIDFAPRAALLTFEEIVFICEVLAEMGVIKVRLTGGEPLSRRGLPDLVDQLGQLFPKLAMTTNGVLLPPVLDRLLAAGLRTYNVSLDTLRPDRFRRITRRDAFAGTWAAIEALEAHPGTTVKINAVVMTGINDDELADFVELTRNRKLAVRFIEAMPFNDDDGNHHLFLPAAAMLEQLRKSFATLAPISSEQNASALRYQVPGFRGTVGIIPAHTRSLCGMCNRLRLTPRGTFLSCLYSRKGLELLPLVRGGITKSELSELLYNFLRGKARDGHETQRREQSGTVFASMTSIGG